VPRLFHRSRDASSGIRMRRGTPRLYHGFSSVLIGS
jgi:hypothetical protein